MLHNVWQKAEAASVASLHCRHHSNGVCVNLPHKNSLLQEHCDRVLLARSVTCAQARDSTGCVLTVQCMCAVHEQNGGDRACPCHVAQNYAGAWLMAHECTNTRQACQCLRMCKASWARRAHMAGIEGHTRQASNVTHCRQYSSCARVKRASQHLTNIDQGAAGKVAGVRRRRTTLVAA